ncbi:MAG TPA: hypothetical protein VHJ83_06730, partial [Micromonosporaceae bacterium]|nr:hypothetical protein [Micromonosporaceae bacterium]
GRLLLLVALLRKSYKDGVNSLPGLDDDRSAWTGWDSGCDRGPGQGEGTPWRHGQPNRMRREASRTAL